MLFSSRHRPSVPAACMQPRPSSNVDSSPSPWASRPGRAHSAASAACARATDALFSCFTGSCARAMAAVNAASTSALAASVVHDAYAPVSGLRSEGMPWLRGAAARRSCDMCMRYEPSYLMHKPGDTRQWWAHVRSSLLRCALRASRRAAASSWLQPIGGRHVASCRCIVRSIEHQPQGSTATSGGSLHRRCKPAFSDAHDNRVST